MRRESGAVLSFCDIPNERENTVNELYFIVSNTVLMLLSVVDIALLIRAVLHWTMPDGEGLLMDLLYVFTEPVILPFRKLIESRGWFEGSPIDMAYMFAILAVGFVNITLTFF